jgi:hypothetical protein
MNTELPAWITVLEHLRPDQINVLTALAELGEIEIEDFIYRALLEKLAGGDLPEYPESS